MPNKLTIDLKTRGHPAFCGARDDQRSAWLIMSLAFWMYAIAVALMRVRAIILEREAHTEWVKELPEVKGNVQ
jgi:hypothetical protein